MTVEQRKKHRSSRYNFLRTLYLSGEIRIVFINFFLKVITRASITYWTAPKFYHEHHYEINPLFCPFDDDGYNHLEWVCAAWGALPLIPRGWRSPPDDDIWGYDEEDDYDY